MWIFLPLSLAYILSLVLTAVAVKAFTRLRLVDVPDMDRKKHAKPTALGGGVPIVFSFILVATGVQIATGFFTRGQITIWHLVGFGVASAILLVHGLWDDAKRLPAFLSLLGPVAAALVSIFAGFGVEKITNPLGGYLTISPLISAIIVFVWLMVAMYGLKLADGVDGLVSSVALVAVFIVSALAMTIKYFQPDVALLALILAAVLIGFLVFNSAPAEIYLGEGGSLWLGYAIGILAIISGSKILTATMVLALPVIDVGLVIIRRLLRGEKIWHGDRLHLHHLLLDRGWSANAVVLFYVTIASLMGLSSLLLSGWQKAASLLIVAVGLFLIFVIRWYEKKN